jgi:hypothetical protein
MRPLLDALGPDYPTLLEERRYLFVEHPAEPRHLQYAGGDMTYGEGSSPSLHPGELIADIRAA